MCVRSHYTYGSVSPHRVCNSLGHNTAFLARGKFIQTRPERHIRANKPWGCIFYTRRNRKKPFAISNHLIISPFVKLIVAVELNVRKLVALVSSIMQMTFLGTATNKFIKQVCLLVAIWTRFVRQRVFVHVTKWVRSFNLHSLAGPFKTRKSGQHQPAMLCVCAQIFGHVGIGERCSLQ